MGLIRCQLEGTIALDDSMQSPASLASPTGLSWTFARQQACRLNRDPLAG